jgi:hypothetical protein
LGAKECCSDAASECGGVHTATDLLAPRPAKRPQSPRQQLTQYWNKMVIDRGVVETWQRDSGRLSACSA